MAGPAVSDPGTARITFSSTASLPQRPFEPSVRALDVHAALPESLQRAIDPTLLTPRIGRSTVASALERTIRIGVVGEGAPSGRELVPHTDLARRLLESPAGPRVEEILRGYLASADAHPEDTLIRGFVLAPDEDAVRATELLQTWERATRDDPNSRVGLAADTRRAADMLLTRVSRNLVGDAVRQAGAWNGDGWVTFFPAASHMLLAAANAGSLPERYGPAPVPGDPTRGELLAKRTAWLRDIGNHEMQHSVTPTDGRNRIVEWEEGIAEVMSKPNSPEQAARMGITLPAMTAALAEPDVFDAGWRELREPGTAQDTSARAQRAREFYAWPEQAIRQLLELGGTPPLTTDAGMARADALLQAPGEDPPHARLAGAIAAEHGIAADAELVRLVKQSVNFQHGREKLAELRARLGLPASAAE